MTILEQRFLETVPSELKRLNDNMSRLITLLENGRKSTTGILQDSVLSETTITDSESAAELLREDLHGLDHEEFWVVLLGNDMKPKSKQMICSGNFTSSIIDYRRVVKEALNSRATAVLAYHNHPSGNLEASKADIEATEQLRNALKLFDIVLVDHIIIGNKGYFSFADEEVKSLK